MKVKGLFQLFVSVIFFSIVYYVLFNFTGIRLVVVLLFICLETARILVEMIIQRQHKQDFTERDKNTFSMINYSVYIYLLVLLIDYTFINQIGNTYSLISGIIVFCIGFTVRIVSLMKLGRYFNKRVVIFKDHRIVKEGIYKFIRHPLYLGIILVYISYVIILGSVLGLLLLVLIIPVYSNRIKVEEAVLLEKFGEEYKRYIENTRKLVPFIW